VQQEPPIDLQAAAIAAKYTQQMLAAQEMWNSVDPNYVAPAQHEQPAQAPAAPAAPAPAVVATEDDMIAIPIADELIDDYAEQLEEMEQQGLEGLQSQSGEAHEVETVVQHVSGVEQSAVAEGSSPSSSPPENLQQLLAEYTQM
jgi:pyruvate/2-oxoglutarate dehydrogenase complex dihydrolipoamide acyltransferase (E2) component